MRCSQTLIATLKEQPGDAQVISHQLLLRSGMIRKLASGLYTWLPLGLRVLSKVTQVVRNQMNQAGAVEILMPMVQPGELWEESGRMTDYGAELLRFTDRHERTFCLGPTHEEVVTDLVRQQIQSYKQLPINLYQIQTKFRDEIRPRFGIMRAREFVMKDSYSFHHNEASLKQTYEQMYNTYLKIFDRLGLAARAVSADSGSIGGDYSHEFHVLADSGEDTIAFSTESNYAANLELSPDLKENDPSPDGQGTIQIKRGIEVGHIFQLGTKYSEAMNLEVLDEHGKSKPLVMGCYGIGISRIVAAAIEQNHDEKGIIWPQAMAPYTLVILGINVHKSDSVREFCENLYTEYNTQTDVLYDDRNERPGVKFADMELIGIPHQIIVGERALEEQQVEYRRRADHHKENIPLDQLGAFVKKLISE